MVRPRTPRPLLWAGLVAVLALSLFIGLFMPFPLSRSLAGFSYATLLKAFGPPLGALVLGAIVVEQSLRADRRALEGRILARVNWTLGLGAAAWDGSLEESINQALALGGDPEGAAFISEALTVRRGLARRHGSAAASGILPVVAMASVVGVAAWAIPASEVFLSYSFPQVNRVLMVYEVLGSVFALAASLYLIARLARPEQPGLA